MEGITFRRIKNKLILIFTISDYSQSDWVREELKKNGAVTLKRTFQFREKHTFKVDYEDFDYDEYPPIGFILGIQSGEYYQLDSDVLGTANTFFIHSEIDFKSKLFIAESKISILYHIDKLVSEDIYIGGTLKNAMPFEAYSKMLNDFPTTHEKKLYSQARVSSTIKNYFGSTVDAELKLHKFFNKKRSIEGADLIKTFKDYELIKYTTIYNKLIKMLSSENGYNENQWQDEILQIILLLYPKYIFACKTVYIKIDEKKRRFLDFMLIDSDGHVDVIEIKKPFENSIIASGDYRGNYIPHKDLTGTIMQLEKYLFHLNRYGSRGEEELSKTYSKSLPSGITISITNPRGFVIMGRDNNLSKEQLSDFEIVKRKYKNVIDIITYDDLLRRLNFTIQQIKNV